MPQVTVYIREEDIDKWKAIQRKSEFISNALNGLSSNGRTEVFEASDSGSSPDEPAKYPRLTPPPVKREYKESPPLIRNMAEAIREDEEEYDEPALYDKARPFWSPFGPLPVRQDPSMPMAVIDPNLDEETRMPLDVDKRNAWLERA